VAAVPALPLALGAVASSLTIAPFVADAQSDNDDGDATDDDDTMLSSMLLRLAGESPPLDVRSSPIARRSCLLTPPHPTVSVPDSSTAASTASSSDAYVRSVSDMLCVAVV
jgi:hypothetical protein